MITLRRFRVVPVLVILASAVSMAWADEDLEPRLLPQLDPGTTYTGEASMTADGRLVAVGRDGSIEVWDTESGWLRWRLVPPAPASLITMDPEGRYLLAMTAIHTVTIWDLHSGEVALNFRHMDFLNAARFRFLPDGRFLMQRQGSAFVYSVANGDRYGAFYTSAPSWRNIVVAERAKKLLMMDEAGFLFVRNLDDYEITRQIRVSQPDKTHFTADGTALLTQTSEGWLVFEAATGAKMHELNLSSALHVVDFKGTRRGFLVTHSPSGRYQAYRWPQMDTLGDPFDADMVGLSQRGNQLFRFNTGANAHTIEVRHLEDEETLSLITPVADVDLLKLSLTDELDAVFTLTYRGPRWQSMDGTLDHTLRGQMTGTSWMLLGDGGRTMVTGNLDDATVGVWFLPQGKLFSRLDDVSPNQFMLNATLSDNEERLAIALSGEQQGVGIWQATSGQQLHWLSLDQPAFGLEFVSDQQLWIGTSEPALQVANVSSGEITTTLTGHEASIVALALAPSSTTMVSADVDRGLMLWDTEEPGFRQQLEGHGSGIRDLAFLNDGAVLASAASQPDNTIHVWDLATGERLHVWAGHSDMMTGIVSNPTGSQLASIGFDGRVIIWDLASGQRAASFEASNVEALRWRRDGQALLLGLTSGEVTVHDLSGQLEATWQAPWTSAAVVDLQRHPESDTVVVQHLDGQLMVWNSATNSFQGGLYAWQSGWAAVHASLRYDGEALRNAFAIWRGPEGRALVRTGTTTRPSLAASWFGFES